MVRNRAASKASGCQWSRALTLVLTVSLLIPLANSSASDAPQNEWHIQILIPRDTYYLGETINVTGTISPPLSATVLLTFIVPDGSPSTFPVNSDDAGNFSFGRQFPRGSYSVFALIGNPQPNGSVTTDFVSFIIISKVQPPPDSTTSNTQTSNTQTSTTQTSTVSSTTGTPSSTTQADNGSSQPSNTGWTLTQAIEAAAAVIVVSVALLVVKLRRRA
jgi:hypothetical protein